MESHIQRRRVEGRGARPNAEVPLEIMTLPRRSKQQPKESAPGSDFFVGGFESQVQGGHKRLGAVYLDLSWALDEEREG